MESEKKRKYEDGFQLDWKEERIQKVLKELLKNEAVMLRKTQRKELLLQNLRLGGEESFLAGQVDGWVSITLVFI